MVLVAVQLSVLGLYRPPVLNTLAANPAPDDHFAAGPHCCMGVSGSGRVGGAGGCPGVRAGIVSAAGVYKGAAVKSPPHDHFATGPHCRVKLSACGRVGGADGCPGVRAGIISPAGV